MTINVEDEMQKLRDNADQVSVIREGLQKQIDDANKRLAEIENGSGNADFTKNDEWGQLYKAIQVSAEAIVGLDAVEANLNRVK